jgi:glycine cleavage system H protein
MADEKSLRYTPEHEWVRVDASTDSRQAGGIATIGITAYAADKLGDVVFVDLPTVGSTVASGKVVGEIESTKSVGELFAPVDGEVTEINDAVVASPELVNSDPFGAGWLVKLRFTDLPPLLSHAEYSALVGE